MKKLVIVILGLLISFSLTTSYAKDVKIGLMTTLSGGGSHLGVDVRDGFMLAMEQSGRDDIEVFIRDDARKPGVAKKIANELVQRENVDIMTGCIFSNLAMAIVPSLVRQGIFYLSPNAGPSKLAGDMCHKNYFNVAWQNDQLHEAMGIYMKKSGLKKPFILAPNYPAGTDALKGFKRGFDGKIANEVYTQLGQTDYASEIARIRSSDADSVFFFLPGGMGIAFQKQFDVNLPLFGAAFSFDEIIINSVGEAAIGAKNTSQWAYDLENPTNQAFVESFKAKYDRIPTLYASQGFDTANLILSALEKAHPEDQDAFRAALRTANFKSTRGDFRFGCNHHPIHDIYVREVVTGEDGKPTNKLVGIAVEDHQDAYADQCSMDWK